MAFFESEDVMQDRVLIEHELEGILAREQSSLGPLVFQCMNYAIFPGGKRLRPLLGMRIARAFEADPKGCLTHLAAVELIHTASLVLDDLPCMDDATLRRARPPAHVQFGEAIAILAALSLVILSVRLGQTQTPNTCSSAVAEFQDMVLNSIGKKGLIVGQELDLTAKDFDGADVSNHWKTAPLFELACAAGLVCCDLPLELRSCVLEFGRSYGRAFQAIDDLIDDKNVNHFHLTRALSLCASDLNKLKLRNRAFEQLDGFVEWLLLQNTKTDSYKESEPVRFNE